MSAVLYAQSIPKSAPQIASRDWSHKLQQAKTLEVKGRNLEAKALYDEILKDPQIPAEAKKKIQVDYHQLNLQILVARIHSQEGMKHKVVKGDTLYDIAIKYRTTVDMIKKNNKLKKDTIYPGMMLKISSSVLSLRVDKSDNIMILQLNSQEIKRYSVATGRGNNTPVGEFKIINKLENPTWFHAGAIVPPDSPENILGTRWLGFDHPGYGIHGTTLPETIGHQASSGCVRMFNHDVEELYAVIPTGTKVIIVD